MNDGFLLADCVFEYLVNIGFIHNAVWKHNTRELYYTASFIIKGTRASIASFEVTVYGDCHRVTKSNVRIMAKRHRQNFDTVFLNCALH